MRSAILAGGAARRFEARPKGLQTVGGRRILDAVVDTLVKATGELPLLIANDPEAVEWHPDLVVRADVYPGTASLGGIYTALLAGDGPVFVAAWDMPFLPPDLAQACAHPILQSIEAGQLHTTAFHDTVRVGRLPLATVERFGNPDELFFNVNTREELAAARALQRRRDRGDSRSA